MRRKGLNRIVRSRHFKGLITTDQNLRYQQNLAKRQIAIVVLSFTSWPRVQKVLPDIVEAISSIQQSGYAEVVVA
jgi:hypothetical protein